MFERQFYLVHENLSVNHLPNFKVISLNNWSLAVQEKNYYSTVKNNNLEVHIIGCFVHPDYKDIAPNNFAKMVLGDCANIDEINNALYKSCGRFLVIVIIEEKIVIRSDAVSLAQIHFDKINKVICTDIRLYEHLINDRAVNLDAKSFYINTMPYRANGDGWIGEDTIYENLQKLLPNQALNLPDFSVYRYWPTSPKNETNLGNSLIEIADNLKDTLQAFQNLAPLSVAVTSGNDSRLALAVSLSLEQDCYYFIDKLPEMKSNDVDIVIGKQLCDIAGVKYHVHDIGSEDAVPSAFKKVYFKNTFFAKNERLAVAHYYSEHLKNYINICGVGEFGRSVYGNGVIPASENYLCHKYHYTNSKFANAMARKWLNKYKVEIGNFGYNPYSLFYIEQRLGNWGAVGNSESDIALEEVNPYASHYNIEKFLSLPKGETTYINNKVFYALTAHFNDLFSALPVNPVYKFKKKIAKFVKATPLFPIIDYLIFIYKGKVIGKFD